MSVKVTREQLMKKKEQLLKSLDEVTKSLDRFDEVVYKGKFEKAIHLWKKFLTISTTPLSILSVRSAVQKLNLTLNML